MTLAHFDPLHGSLNLRTRLRTETAQLHELVDNRFRHLICHSEEGYANFLTVIARAILPIEAALEAADVDKALPDWRRRARSFALRADLAALSLPVPEAASRFAAQSKATQFGVLYVLEGSRFGAKAILHAMNKAPCPVGKSARRYLSHGSGEPLWQSFLAWLEASPEANRNVDEVLDGARSAFRMFL